MTWFDRSNRASLWLAVTLVSSTASALECAELRVDTDESVRATWPGLAERVRSTFAEREGVEACARIRLVRVQGAIRVDVTLPDGRSASRWVRERDDVVPVLEALLLVPPSDAAPSAPESAAPSEHEQVKAPEPEAVRPKPRRTRLELRIAERDLRDPEEPPSGGLGFEVSAFASTRTGDGQVSLGVGLLSFVELSAWLVGFSARADSYPGPSPPPGPTLEAALLAGRRLRFESTALDIFAGPALLVQGETESVWAGPAGEYRETSSGTSPRFTFGSHLHFATDSILRSFVGVEAEIGQKEGSTASLDGPSEAPSWMFGVAAGATVGTR
jgi:hypothetical protein